MKMRFSYFALVCLLVSLGSTAWAQLPDGPGKDTLVQICGKCHSAGVVAGYSQTKEAWTSTISKMIEQGAEGTDDQYTAILDYLVKNFGPPVNVNKATSSELQTQLDITPKEADAIVKYRTENGNFKTIDDLKNVPDLDFKKIQAKKDHIAF